MPPITFSIDGMCYETSAMEVFHTGDLEVTAIYLDRDCRVFARTRVKGGEDFRQLTTPQIKEMLQRYGFQPLRRALREQVIQNPLPLAKGSK